MFQPSPRDLAQLLRDSSSWPPGFVWDYSNCNTCALGLAKAVGWVKEPTGACVGKVLGIPSVSAMRIFYHGGQDNGELADWRSTSPETIAEELEKLNA